MTKLGNFNILSLSSMQVTATGAQPLKLSQDGWLARSICSHIFTVTVYLLQASQEESSTLAMSGNLSLIAATMPIPSGGGPLYWISHSGPLTFKTCGADTHLSELHHHWYGQKLMTGSTIALLGAP